MYFDIKQQKKTRAMQTFQKINKNDEIQQDPQLEP